MARYLMSMCLLQLPLLLFFAIKAAVELLQYILNDLDIESIILSSKMKLLSHTPCKVASKQDMNSGSIVEVAVKVCLMLLQDTAPPTNIKMYPDVDLCESTQPAKQPTKSKSE